jgi:hypothetical protein
MSIAEGLAARSNYVWSSGSSAEEVWETLLDRLKNSMGGWMSRLFPPTVRGCVGPLCYSLVFSLSLSWLDSRAYNLREGSVEKRCYFQRSPAPSTCKSCQQVSRPRLILSSSIVSRFTRSASLSMPKDSSSSLLGWGNCLRTVMPFHALPSCSRIQVMTTVSRCPSQCCENSRRLWQHNSETILSKRYFCRRSLSSSVSKRRTQRAESFR